MEQAHSILQMLSWTIHPVDSGKLRPFSQSGQLYTCVHSENELHLLREIIRKRIVNSSSLSNHLKPLHCMFFDSDTLLSTSDFQDTNETRCH